MAKILISFRTGKVALGKQNKITLDEIIFAKVNFKLFLTDFEFH